MSLDEIWVKLEALESNTLTHLFDTDPNRLALLSGEQSGILFDFSKTHLTSEIIAHFVEMAKAQNLGGKRDDLFNGQIVNVTEGRAAEHSAERGQGNRFSVQRAKSQQVKMRALVEAIDKDVFGGIDHVLHLGIGGSALGPKLFIDALGRDKARYDVEVVSNVDGCAIKEAVLRFDPHRTLVVVASKTFTTTETLLNAESALDWMTASGVDDPFGKFVALTAAPEKAIEWGIDESRILAFSESVGGRYSIWSSIGFPLAVALGWKGFEDLLAGAAEMDQHFRDAPVEQNWPMIAAFADLFYTQVHGAQTRAVFAYDERMRLLSSYLQQLEMESNGKRVSENGTLLDRQSAPVTWGGVGTDAQHAVFQLLHQGTGLIPVEFVASIEPGHELKAPHHHQLLGNCFAQGAALMAGRAHVDEARAYPGNRPSTTLLLNQLDPRTFGALIAFYEQRVFVNAVLLGINPFDQFGVELGKQMAQAIETGGEDFDPSTLALLERAGL
jgi:glucose-6-phosphate isomerase